MSTVALRCRYCGNQKTFIVADADDAIAKIDASGWQTAPLINGVRQDVCPHCDDSDRGEPK